MNNPKISIIVPVYKTEKYLQKCINSILAQSYVNLEIILVDDGSPDKCPDICDKYALDDRRVKVIHSENKGVSAARNIGLDAAIGDYVTFVDSDDYIEKNMYQSMMRIAVEYLCDFVLCDCVKDYPDYSVVYSHCIREGYYNHQQLKDEYYQHLLIMDNLEYPATISNWVCLFKRDLLIDENNQLIRYISGVRFSEDLLFGAQVLYNAKSFYYMKNKAYYHYVIHQQSASHVFQADKWNDYKRLYYEMENYFSAVKNYDFTKQLDLVLLFFVLNSLNDILCSDIIHYDRKQLEHHILKDKNVIMMFKRIRISRLPINTKLKIKIFAYKKGIVF